jgi:ABC-type spermidine/putrescine transport system permease subunit I
MPMCQNGSADVNAKVHGNIGQSLLEAARDAAQPPMPFWKVAVASSLSGGLFGAIFVYFIG